MPFLGINGYISEVTLFEKYVNLLHYSLKNKVRTSNFQRKRLSFHRKLYSAFYVFQPHLLTCTFDAVNNFPLHKAYLASLITIAWMVPLATISICYFKVRC